MAASPLAELSQSVIIRQNGLSHPRTMLPIRIPFSSSFPRTTLSRKFLVPTQIFSRNMHVIPVPVREDNYAYLLVDKDAKKAAAIDPYDVPKVKAAADEAGVEIVAAITTHHHFDHSGGNQVCKSMSRMTFLTTSICSHHISSLMLISPSAS